MIKRSTSEVISLAWAHSRRVCNMMMWRNSQSQRHNRIAAIDTRQRIGQLVQTTCIGREGLSVPYEFFTRTYHLFLYYMIVRMVINGIFYHRITAKDIRDCIPIYTRCEDARM